MLVINSQGSVMDYTANVGPGTVSVIDLQEKKVVKITFNFQSDSAHCQFRPMTDGFFTSDQTKPQLALIDTTKNRSDQMG